MTKRFFSHLRSSCRSYVLILFSFTVCSAVISCASSAHDSTQTLPRRGPIAPQKASAAAGSEQVPPWEFSKGGEFPKGVPSGSPELLQGFALEQKGKFAEALRSYQTAVSSAPSSRLAEEALLRECGLLLKLGKSKDVLTQISKYARARGQEPHQLEARFSLIAAYSYVHQRDLDQALAWFSQAIRVGAGQGVLPVRARSEVSELLRSLPLTKLNAHAQKWEQDPLIHPMFKRETVRRAQGGIEERYAGYVWFSPEHYGASAQTAAAVSPQPSLNAELPPAEVESQSSEQVFPTRDEELVLGLLLPFQGQYASHAQRIREGIEAAVSDFGEAAKTRIVSRDSADPTNSIQAQYQALVDQDGARVVLGPLLVKETEVLARSSESEGTPFVTFAKRDGLPELGRTVYRLGATAENQVEELLRYTAREQGKRKFVILSPSNEAAQEYRGAFLKKAANFSVSIVGDYNYASQDEQSAKAVIEKLTRAAQENLPEAIFVPDTLDSAVQVLHQLRSSPLKDVLVFGPALWNDPVVLRGFSQVLEGAIYVSLFEPESERPKVRRFVKSYRERFKREPDVLAAQAYDATLFVLSAARGEAGAGRPALAALDNAQNIEGVTGLLSITPAGDITRRLSIVRLQGGQLLEVTRSYTSSYGESEREG